MMMRMFIYLPTDILDLTHELDFSYLERAQKEYFCKLFVFLSQFFVWFFKLQVTFFGPEN